MSFHGEETNHGFGEEEERMKHPLVVLCGVCLCASMIQAADRTQHRISLTVRRMHPIVQSAHSSGEAQAPSNSSSVQIDYYIDPSLKITLSTPYHKPSRALIQKPAARRSTPLVFYSEGTDLPTSFHSNIRRIKLQLLNPMVKGEKDTLPVHLTLTDSN